MADDVIITGLNGVPAWATEDTLTKIHDVLKKTLGIQKAAYSFKKNEVIRYRKKNKTEAAFVSG